jgi:hypothetical protein
MYLCSGTYFYKAGVVTETTASSKHGSSSIRQFLQLLAKQKKIYKTVLFVANDAGNILLVFNGYGDEHIATIERQIKNEHQSSLS